MALFELSNTFGYERSNDEYLFIVPLREPAFDGVYGLTFEDVRRS